MSDGSMIIARKFEELLARSAVEGIANFTGAERIIYYLIIVRCAKDMDGFASIFEQTLSLDEIKEAVQHLNNLKLHDLANLLGQAIILLESDDFFGESGEPVKRIASHLLEPLEQIGKEVGDRLWDIDDVLYTLLQSEQSP